MSHLISPFRTRAPIVVLAGLTLALSLIHCAPGALSQSKIHAAAGSPNVLPPVGSGPVKPIGINSLNPNDGGAALTNEPASVQEFSAYQTDIEALPAEQRLSLSAHDAPEALEAFKTSRSIMIHFAGHSPDHCKLYLGLSLSERSITTLGWNTTANPITADCIPEKDGNWKITISQLVTQETWTQLSAKLDGLTIYVANNPRMSWVGGPQSNQPHQPGHGGVHITPNTPPNTTPPTPSPTP